MRPGDSHISHGHLACVHSLHDYILSLKGMERRSLHIYRSIYIGVHVGSGGIWIEEDYTRGDETLSSL